MYVTDRHVGPDGALTMVEITAGNWTLTIADTGWPTAVPSVSLRADDGAFGLEWYYVWPFFRPQDDPPPHLRVLEVESPPAEWLKLVQLDSPQRVAAACHMLGLYEEPSVIADWHWLPPAVRSMIERLSDGAGGWEGEINIVREEARLLSQQPNIPAMVCMTRFFELLDAPALSEAGMKDDLADGWQRLKSGQPSGVLPSFCTRRVRTEASPLVPEVERLTDTCCRLLTDRAFRRHGRGIAITRYLDRLFPAFRRRMVGYAPARIRELGHVINVLTTGVLGPYPGECELCIPAGVCPACAP